MDLYNLIFNCDGEGNRLIVDDGEKRFVTMEDGQVVYIEGPGQGSGAGVLREPRSPFAPTGQGLGAGRARIKTAGFDEEEERLLVMEPMGAQSSRARPGITRDQVVAFHRRRDAARAAVNMRYTDGRNAAGAVDEAIAKGLNRVKIENRWVTLHNEAGEGLRFGSAVERDYIDTVLNRGAFMRNY